MISESNVRSNNKYQYSSFKSKKTGPNSFKLKVLGALIIGIIIYNGICIFIIASSKSFRSVNPKPLWALTIAYHVADISFYLVTVTFILKVNRDTFKECLMVRNTVNRKQSESLMRMDWPFWFSKVKREAKKVGLVHQCQSGARGCERKVVLVPRELWLAGIITAVFVLETFDQSWWHRWADWPNNDLLRSSMDQSLFRAK